MRAAAWGASEAVGQGDLRDRLQGLWRLPGGALEAAWGGLPAFGRRASSTALSFFLQVQAQVQSEAGGEAGVPGDPVSDTPSPSCGIHGSQACPKPGNCAPDAPEPRVGGQKGPQKEVEEPKPEGVKWV